MTLSPPQTPRLQNGQCTPRPQNWSHDQSNFSSHCAMLRLDIIQMARALTTVGSPLRSVETLWPCEGRSNFRHLTANLQKAKKRLIATHANSKIPVSHSQKKTSHFLIATKSLFPQAMSFTSPDLPRAMLPKGRGPRITNHNSRITATPLHPAQMRETITFY